MREQRQDLRRAGHAEWGLTLEQIEAAAQRARDAMAALEGATKVRMTSGKGTDVTITIEGRPALEITPSKRGQMMARCRSGRRSRSPPSRTRPRGRWSWTE